MKKYVIANGGLGNQMFQYAFYLSLKKKGTECFLDNSLFNYSKMHNGYELEKVFGIQACKEGSSLPHTLFSSFLRKYRPSFLCFCDIPYQFCEDVYLSSKPFLIGDWLSERYFREYEREVYESFSFRTISESNYIEADQIRQSNAVSIHIRRGDYLSLPNYNVCDESYYKKAISHIIEKVESPIFYVFSNEPLWCDDFMKQFHVKYKIVDRNQGKDSYQDMFLMTQCKHNIIANSTFSWWGAWLNQNEGKIVVAPRHWFRNNDKNINCPGWVLIDTSKQYGK